MSHLKHADDCSQASQPKISPLTERHRLLFGGIPNISHANLCHKCPFRGIPNAFTRHAEAFGGRICVSVIELSCHFQETIETTGHLELE